MVESSTGGQPLAPSLWQRLFIALYLGSHKAAIGICFLLRAAESGVKAGLTGVWLGLMNPAMIRVLDGWYYTRGFAMYLDPAYNRSGFFDWEQSAVEAYFSKLSSVLIAVGAGAGREMLALNRMGISVEGFEYNPALVELGNRLLAEDGYPQSLYAGPVDEVVAGERRYEGVVVGWAAYSLIPGRAARIRLLRQIRARCVPGAPILLSFFCRSGGDRSFRMIARIADGIRVVLRRPRVEPGDTINLTWTHRFTEAEIADELSAAGFRGVLFQSEPYGHAVGIAVEKAEW